MTVMLIMNILLVVAAVSGMYFIAHQRKVGFIIFTVVEVSMAYIGWATRNYGLVIAPIFYFCMNVYSYIQWSKRERRRA